jgi:membrane fusion protein (multidrug efflux system)
VEAQSELARINLARIITLRKENTVSQAELDAAEAALKQSQGNADAIRATIAKKTIRAPFAGRLGVRLVNLGQYLDTGKPIVNLQSLDTVFVDFALPQHTLTNLAAGMLVRVTTDAYQGRRFEGRLTTISPALDQSTRSVGLQATLNNQGHSLRPGMFARVEVVLPAEQSVLVIPLTSVLSAPFGDSVFVIEEQPGSDKAQGGLVARQQFVRTGRSQGDFVVVESGLTAGQRVVLSGLFKLRNGVQVVVSDAQVPAASNAPKPLDS